MALCISAIPQTLAQWTVQKQLPGGLVTTGTFEVDAQWIGGPPDLGSLFPGKSSAPARFEVTGNSVGTTLRWRLQLESTVNLEFRDYVTFRAYVGECGTGTLIAGIYPATGSLGPTNSVSVCATYTLSASAPSSLQGLQANPVITVKGIQEGN